MPPLPPVTVRARLITGLGTFAADLLAGAAILEIEDATDLKSYWCEANVDRGALLGFRLRRFGSGEVYDLPSTLDSCTCPDATFRGERPGGCRHQRAMRAALATVPGDSTKGAA
ncbi:MAG TPA: hypothetical protein VFW33_08680 [Gemmataceae bacterium]|nr:hypothetical protein [Gemmataceae bacterium]